MGSRREDEPFRVNPNQAEFLPQAFYDVLHAEVELAAHDRCVGFAGELVQEVEADAVDFVVDVEAVIRYEFDSCWVLGWVIDRGWLTSECISGGLS